LRKGDMKKTELIKEAHENSDVSLKRLKQALKDHAGQGDWFKLWNVRIEDKNSQIYCLNQK
jgi:hypothetical protein